MGFERVVKEVERVVKQEIRIAVFTCDWCTEKVEKQEMAGIQQNMPEGWFSILQNDLKNEKFICPKCYDLRLK